MPRRAKKFQSAAGVGLHWSHLGVAYRVTAWPEVAMERREAEQWGAAEVGEEALASGMQELDAAAWRRYLEFMPASERAFLHQFHYGRLAALMLVARGPRLLSDLNETPALVAFMSAHASLRGMDCPHWAELVAIHERGGIYAVLEWLGLPASRETFLVLHNLSDPDVPRRLLEPLRALLWRPMARFVLQHTAQLTDRQLTQYCHDLAA